MQISGIIRNVIYRNEQNSFTVLTIEQSDKQQTVRAVGTIGPVREGDSIVIEGVWQEHNRYGHHFKISNYSISLPQNVQGIEAFLQSGHINGIGPKMAKEITGFFGIDTIRILDEEPERLAELPNIGPKRLQAIIQGWQVSKEKRDSLIFLQGLGLSMSLINKAIQRFGDKAAITIRNNPFSLTHLPGIGFQRADKVAREMGFSLVSPERIRAGINHIMSDIINNGHCAYPRQDLINEAVTLLRVSIDQVELEYQQLVQEGLFLEKQGETIMSYRADLAQAETLVSHHLKRIQQSGLSMKNILSVDVIEKRIHSLEIKLSSAQKLAVRTALHSKVAIIAGGPGTGKTTVIKVILSISIAHGMSIKCAAPTGRAAQRMKEATGITSHTIHRLLEYNPVLARFVRNEKKQIEADLLVIDEMSMVDIFIMSSLVRAVGDKTQVVFIGDADQLPSVGPGNVFGDMISSQQFEVIRLIEIFRQQAQSFIIENAHLINQGKNINYSENRSYRKHNDFFFISRNDPKKTVETLLQVVSKRIPEAFGFDPLYDVQVLTPMNEGVTGAKQLNMRLQRELNPGLQDDYGSDFPFHKGDRVMQIRNNYNRGQTGIFNGDIGFIKTIDWPNKKVIVSFDEEIAYSFDDLNELILAYAITVHKSQGSEYPAVVLPLLTQHYVLLQRNLLYTAVTRAKKLVVIIGSYKALSIAIHNTETSSRYTGLSELLQTTKHQDDL